MKLLWPWLLLGLLPIAVVAAWTVLRFSLPVHVVASLELWRGAGAKNASRGATVHRPTASWILLLAGAVAGVLAAAGPVLPRGRAVRTVAVAVYPSAELGEGGMAALREAAGVLLGRLDPADEVDLLLPALLGGRAERLSPGEAVRRITELPTLPVAAGDLDIPLPRSDGARVYHFVRAGGEVPAGPKDAVILLPTDLPPVRLRHAGAVPAGDGMRVLLDVTTEGGAVPVHAELLRDGEWVRQPVRPVDVPPDGGAVVLQYPAADAIALRLAEGGPAAEAYFARRERVVSGVALLGPDRPMLRRFVRVAPWLELVAGADEADLLITVGLQSAGDKPALVVAPPSPPAGWVAGERVGNLSLADAVIEGEGPLRRRVSLDGVAVRSARPWVPIADRTHHRPALAVEQGALVLVHEGDPRRVYLAFDVALDATNWSLEPSFVVFLADATRWLRPDAAPETTYESLPPSVGGPVGELEVVSAGGGTYLPEPGLYRTPAGDLLAVSLWGLDAGETDGDPIAAAAAAPLAPPVRARRPLSLWPWLAGAAGGLWLGGWALRRAPRADHIMT